MSANDSSRGPAAPGGLGELSAAALDVLVVGGGVTGACIALESARRGLAVGLVERDDYGAGATANCLKIVHGGLRYLQHLDLKRVRASTAERSVWLRSAPHLVDPLPVLLPTYRGRFPPRSALAAAIVANELLSAGRNRGLLPERRIPRARVLSKPECLALEPSVEAPGLTGGVLFYDALMYSPERLTLEVVAAARSAGAIAANHTEFVESTRADGRVTGGLVRDVVTGETATVRAHWIVNATGSMAPAVAARLTSRPAATPQDYSVALSFVTRHPAPQVAYTVNGAPRDGARTRSRQLFVVPWRGQTMIGTAHMEYRGDPARFEPQPEHIERFADEIASARPDLALGQDDIALVHAGLLPVAPGLKDGDVRLLKHHRIVDHAKDGSAGALSVVTVKFTTAGQVARDVVNRLMGTGSVQSNGPPRLPLPGGGFDSLQRLHADARRRYGDLLPEAVLEHLVRTYGAQYGAVIENHRDIAAWNEQIVPEAPVIRAQLYHGVRAEMARTPDDLLWRRTELGPRGLSSPNARKIAEEAIAGVRTTGESTPVQAAR
jgi:glycerol-3-phosphate dehydrogenase